MCRFNFGDKNIYERDVDDAYIYEPRHFKDTQVVTPKPINVSLISGPKQHFKNNRFVRFSI